MQSEIENPSTDSGFAENALSGWESGRLLPYFRENSTARARPGMLMAPATGPATNDRRTVRRVRAVMLSSRVERDRNRCVPALLRRRLCALTVLCQTRFLIDFDVV